MFVVVIENGITGLKLRFKRGYGVGVGGEMRHLTRTRVTLPVSKHVQTLHHKADYHALHM